MPKLKDFKIGADPEFLLVTKRGSPVSGKKIHGRNPSYSEIGCDGNGYTCEMRPEPSENPLEVVANIYDILHRKAASYPKFLTYDWHAGSFKCNRYPLGGHIHFGIKQGTQDLLRSLAAFLAPVLLLLEDKEGAVSRRRHGYGTRSDMRTQAHGIEFRFPSSWLTSPHVSAGVLCLAKTVAYEQHIKKGLSRTEVEAAHGAAGPLIDTLDQARLREIYPGIWARITQMEKYGEYQGHIDFLNFLVSNKLTWLPTCGMREAWGIVDSKKSFSTKVDLEEIWQ